MFRKVLLTSLVALGLGSSMALAGHNHHGSQHHNGHYGSSHHDGYHYGHHYGHNYCHNCSNFGCSSGSCVEVAETPVSYEPSFTVWFRSDAQQEWQSAGSYALSEALQVKSTLQQSSYETFLKSANN